MSLPVAKIKSSISCKSKEVSELTTTMKGRCQVQLCCAYLVNGGMRRMKASTRSENGESKRVPRLVWTIKESWQMSHFLRGYKDTPVTFVTLSISISADCRHSNINNSVRINNTKCVCLWAWVWVKVLAITFTYCLQLKLYWTHESGGWTGICWEWKHEKNQRFTSSPLHCLNSTDKISSSDPFFV